MKKHTCIILVYIFFSTTQIVLAGSDSVETSQSKTLSDVGVLEKDPPQKKFIMKTSSSGIQEETDPLEDVILIQREIMKVKKEIITTRSQINSEINSFRRE